MRRPSVPVTLAVALAWLAVALVLGFVIVAIAATVMTLFHIWE